MSLQPRLLVVEHQETCPPARYGEWLSAAGLELEVVRPYAGDRLPSGLDDAAGLLVLGGSMGANDDASVAWLAATKALLRATVADRLPTLGICLGHQLLVTACGGRVQPNPAGKTMGVLPLGPTAAAADDPLLAGLSPPIRAVQWNDDIAVDLPPQTTLLAATADGVPQAVRVGEAAWGVQFHPEASVGVVTAWARKDQNRAPAAGRDVAKALADIAAAEDELADTWRPVAERFAAVVREGRQGRVVRAAAAGSGLT